MVEFMREIGLIILNMEKGMKNLAMDLCIKVITSRESQKDVGGISGIMEKYTKGSGSMVSSMVQEFGGELKVTPILVSGDREELTVMEFTHGSMEIDIRDNLRTVSNMEKE